MRKFLAIILSVAMIISAFTGVAAADLTRDVYYYVNGYGVRSLSSGDVSIKVTHQALSEDTTVVGAIYEDGRLFSIKTVPAGDAFTTLPYGNLTIDETKVYTFKEMYISNTSSLSVETAPKGGVYTESADLLDYDKFSEVSNVNFELVFFRSESTNKTNTYSFGKIYDLEYEMVRLDAKLYVNGIEYEKFPSDPKTAINTYIAGNPAATVLLENTDNDKDIEIIRVDYYIDAQVASVVSGENYTVNLKNVNTDIITDSCISVNPSEKNVTYTLGGTQIQYTDLKENDVLSIAYDVNADAFSDSSFYNVLVTRECQTDLVRSAILSGDRFVYKIGDKKYITSPTSVCRDMVVGNYYTFYINAFGQISYCENYVNMNEYGIFYGATVENGEVFVTVFNTESGKTKYPVKASIAEGVKEEIAKFYTKLNEGENPYADENLVNLEKRIVKFGVMSGQITDVYAAPSTQTFIEKGLIYNSTTQKLGKIPVHDDAIVLDLTANDDVTGNAPISKVSRKTIDELRNGYVYYGYTTAKVEETGEHKLVVITDRFVPYSDNIFIYDNKHFEYDDYYGAVVNVIEAYGSDLGIKTTLRDAQLSECGLVPGAVFVYKENEDGYADDICVIYDGPESEYDTYMDNISEMQAASEDDNSKLVWPNTFLPSEWSQTDDTTPTGNVEILFGAVSAVRSNNIAVAQIEDCTVEGGVVVKGYDSEQTTEYLVADDANIYTYDYSKASERISTGEIIKTNAIYKLKGDGSDTKNIIPLKYEDGKYQQINFIFAKVVDDVITECFVILGEDVLTTENTGIFNGAYLSTTDELYVSFIGEDGKITEYPVEDSDKEHIDQKIKAYYKTDEYTSDNRVDLSNRVVTYTVNGRGYLVDIESVSEKEIFTDNNSNLTYDARTGKIGSYELADEVVIIDLSANADAATSGRIKDIKTWIKSDLTDGLVCSGILSENSNGKYGLFIITSVIDVYTADTSIAVYQTHGTMYDDDFGKNIMSIEAYMYGVYGDEETEDGHILKTAFTKDEIESIGLVPGTVFLYHTNSDGYVDNIDVIYNGPEADYADFITGVSNLTTTTVSNKMVWSNTNLPTDWANTTDYTKTGNVEILFGAVSSVKNGYVYVAQIGDYVLSDGRTVKGYDIEQTEQKGLAADANIYVYDYSFAKPDNRLYIGGQVLATSAGYKVVGENSDTKNIVPLYYEDGTEQAINFIFAKVVDDDITECLVILGE